MTDPAELQRLIDEQAIRDLVARFALALDERRWPDYAALYTEDAVLCLPHGEVRGRAAIERWVEADLGRYVATHHAGGHVVIDLGDDLADVHATLLATHVESEDGRTFWAGGGWYVLRLRRDGDGWLITSTEARPAWLQLTEGARGPEGAPSGRTAVPR